MNNLGQLKDLFANLIEQAIPDDSSTNFYFVKKYDPNLYAMILQNEGLIRTDLVNSAKNIRDILTNFMQKAFANHPKALEYAKKNSEHELSLHGYLSAAKKFKELGINADKGYKMKFVTNIGNHKQERKYEINYKIVSGAYVNLHQFLVDYYSYHHPKDRNDLKLLKYRSNYQPINDMIVYDVEEVGSETCEVQYSCFKKINSTYHYYIVRQYSKYHLSSVDKRDEEVLNKLWNESIRNPQGIVKYTRLESSKGSDDKNDEKLFIIYEMNGRPRKLNESLLRECSDKDKYQIISLLSEGIGALHAKKIYHRNLQPKAVYVYQVEDEFGINLVNFEFSKVMGSQVTVFASAVTNFFDDFIFTAPEVRGIVKSEQYEHVDWEKVDIYALGVLFVYILMGGSFEIKGAKVQSIQAIIGRMNGKGMNPLKPLLTQMCSNVAQNRPTIKQVLRQLEEING